MTTKQYVLDEHTNAWRPVNQWAKPPQVISHIVTAVVAAAVALGVAAMARGEFDTMSQANFPCQEDEALVYAPQFGPDRTGCIHLEGMGK